MSNYVRCVRSNLAAEISRRDLTQARAAELAGLTAEGLSKRRSGQVEFRLGELIRLAHEDYGLDLTEHGITCLVSRGTLTPLDAKSRPQRYGYFACIDYLTARRART